jgi:hypothetical protein
MQTLPSPQSQLYESDFQHHCSKTITTIPQSQPGIVDQVSVRNLNITNAFIDNLNVVFTTPRQSFFSNYSEDSIVTALPK